MGVNRFYRPSRGQYVSQFVPDKLPANLMVQGLVNKERAYDTQSKFNQNLAEWDQRALPGFDTGYRDQKKQEIRSFLDESLNKDLASPEYIREYQEFIRNFKDDEGLKQVSSAVDTHDKYLERYEDLKTKGELEAAEELRFSYLKRFDQYTADLGKGFQGQVGLGDPLVGEGVDIYKDGSRYFRDIKDSGSETLAFLNASGEKLAYKQGWVGVGDKRIQTQMNSMLDNFIADPAGKQLAARFDMENNLADFEIANMSKQDRQQYESAKKDFIANEFIEIGRTFVRGKSTTNADVAYRKATDYSRQDKDKVTLHRTITKKGESFTSKVTLDDLQTNLDTLQLQKTQAEKEITKYQGLIDSEFVSEEDKIRYRNSLKQAQSSLENVESNRKGVSNQVEGMKRQYLDGLRSKGVNNLTEEEKQLLPEYRQEQINSLEASILSNTGVSIDELKALQATAKPVVLDTQTSPTGTQIGTVRYPDGRTEENVPLDAQGNLVSSIGIESSVAEELGLDFSQTLVLSEQLKQYEKLKTTGTSITPTDIDTGFIDSDDPIINNMYKEEFSYTEDVIPTTVSTIRGTNYINGNKVASAVDQYETDLNSGSKNSARYYKLDEEGKYVELAPESLGKVNLGDFQFNLPNGDSGFLGTTKEKVWNEETEKWEEKDIQLTVLPTANYTNVKVAMAEDHHINAANWGSYDESTGIQFTNEGLASKQIADRLYEEETYKQINKDLIPGGKIDVPRYVYMPSTEGNLEPEKLFVEVGQDLNGGYTVKVVDQEGVSVAGSANPQFFDTDQQTIEYINSTINAIQDKVISTFGNP